MTLDDFVLRGYLQNYINLWTRTAHEDSDAGESHLAGVYIYNQSTFFLKKKKRHQRHWDYNQHIQTSFLAWLGTNFVVARGCWCRELQCLQKAGPFTRITPY